MAAETCSESGFSVKSANEENRVDDLAGFIAELAFARLDNF